MAGDDGAGAALTFTTTAHNTFEKVSIQSQGYSREVLETTNHATTGGYKTFIPADFKDPGTVTVSFLYDGDNQPPITIAAENITITYPTTKAAGATEVFSGFVQDWDPPELAIDTVMTASFTIKKTGVPVFTDATT